jgi:hypothetical protein
LTIHDVQKNKANQAPPLENRAMAIRCEGRHLFTEVIKARLNTRQRPALGAVSYYVQLEKRFVNCRGLHPSILAPLIPDLSRAICFEPKTSLFDPHWSLVLQIPMLVNISTRSCVCPLIRSRTTTPLNHFGKPQIPLNTLEAYQGYPQRDVHAPP